MEQSIRFFLIMALAGALLVGTGGALLAQEEDPIGEENNTTDITFPIPELGNCGSKEECRMYCDNAEHADACLAWAQTKGIEINYEKPIGVAPEGGPGGCRGEQECRAFCDDPMHFGECIAYAEEHGRMTAEEAKKLREKLAQGKEDHAAGPGSCDSNEACTAYCSDRSHMEECIQFAIAEGRMSEEQANQILRALRGEEAISRIPKPQITVPHTRIEVEVEHTIDIEKVKKLLEEETGPGGCGTLDACETYCSNPANEEACFAYAVEHDLMLAEEVERIEKIRSIEGPGGCRGRACEAYCEISGHESECLEFAHTQGFIKEEHYSQMKKLMETEGPGGCRGRTCEYYCEDPAHRRECLTFAKETGLIPPEEAEALERIDKKMQESGGPGGCRTEEECRAYCKDPSRFNECAAFAVDAGLMQPDEAQRMLQQFIQVERFDAEQLPLEYRAEFEERFKQFEQFREQFEHGDMPSGFGERGMPPPRFEEEFQRQYQEQYQQEFQKYMPEGVDPSVIQLPVGDERVPPPSFDMTAPYSENVEGGVPPANYEQQFQQQYQKEFQRQYQEQYQQQYQQLVPEGYNSTQSGASPFRVFLELFGF